MDCTHRETHKKRCSICFPTLRPDVPKATLELIAGVIDRAQITEQARWELANDFAHILPAHNANFDRARFIAACFITGESAAFQLGKKRAARIDPEARKRNKHAKEHGVKGGAWKL